MVSLIDAQLLQECLVFPGLLLVGVLELFDLALQLLDLRFLVTQNETYSVEQTADPAVLAQIYGAGPAAGQGPQPAPDGRSHLTLITCTGAIVNGAFDHHVVVYATRSR